MYQSAVGSLLYLSLSKRPDIAFAVINIYVAKFCAKPNKQHWTAAKQILRYLKGTQHFGLLYKSTLAENCTGYSDADWGGDLDADWGGDLDDRKSTSGYVFQMGGAAISWRSKSKRVLPSRQQKLSMLHCQVQHKSRCGCNSSYQV